MLPTPVARDHHGVSRPERGKGTSLHLRDVACGHLLPTPAACNPNDGENVWSWLARRERQQPARALPLAIAVKLLPASKKWLAKGGGDQTGSLGQPGDGTRTLSGAGNSSSAALPPVPSSEEAGGSPGCPPGSSSG
ncbi:hypothetical protein [Spongiactinospora rosea]|uniref:hypothetical protein n=1 Tax=Spongiactinospora rosea TaxID=2248750 RepID=UPI001CEC588B|nr:hypothetical protein [Spongiactinospora rosea]